MGGRQDRSNAEVTIYRVTPQVDNRLVEGGQKALDIATAADFTRAWLESRHGFGRYEVYFNDSSDRPAYGKGAIECESPALYEEMMTAGTCKIDLRTILDVPKNRGFIQAWTARGMWPPNRKENDLDPGVIKELAEIIKGGGGGSAGSMKEMVEMLLLLDKLKPAAAPAGAISPADLERAVREAEERATDRIERAQLATQLAEIKAKLEQQTAATGAASPFAAIEKLLLKRLNPKQVARLLNGDEDGDDEEDWVSLAKRHLPGLASGLLAKLNQQPGAAANPQAAATATTSPAAQAQPDTGSDDIRLIRKLLQLFLEQRTPSAAAVLLVEIENRVDLYDDLKARGPAGLADILATEGTAIPEAAAVLARREDFILWADACFAEYAEDEEGNKDEQLATENQG